MQQRSCHAIAKTHTRGERQTDRHKDTRKRESVFLGVSLESEPRSGTVLGLGFSPIVGGYLILSITAFSGYLNLSESGYLEN